MNTSDKQRNFLSIWQCAKFLWMAQILSGPFFGIPLIAMVLFAAGAEPSVILKIALLYFIISFIIYVPFYGLLSFLFLNPVKKILSKNYNKKDGVDKKEIRCIGRFFNASLSIPVICFFASFLGFIFALFLLWLGLIPEMELPAGLVIFLGLFIGFIVSIIQSSLMYVFLDNYFKPQTEFFNSFYPEIIKRIKIIKFSIFWKIFLLALLAAIVSQVSLGALYLGRVIIYSPEDIKNALIYIIVVAILTLFYIVVIANLSSKNMLFPLKSIISWANKVIKGESKEGIFIMTNDEFLEVTECLKKMHEELEDSKASLEIKIKARTKELEWLTEKQEEIIQERVKDLEQRTEELERFQKIAVGRELKMIELKEKIRELEKDLEQKGRENN